MKLNDRYEILTPDGFQPFDGIQRTYKPAVEIITTTKRIRVSLSHQFICDDKLLTASSLKPGDMVSKGEKVVSISLCSPEYLYDPVNVGIDHTYIANGLHHHNCTFEGSSYTLVDGAKLGTLPFLVPLYSKDNFEAFFQPHRERSYVIVVDVSRGRHHDYSAFSVIDITSMPYQVVATYKDNEISTLEFPHLIYNTARQYNNAFVLVEVNDLGEEVSNTIWYEYEYENLYFTSGNELSQARGYPGVRSTAKVKALGCSMLKELVEKDQLLLSSHRIIEELGLFVKHKKSYAAQDTNVNDDLCTTLWLFAWLTKQDVFQEITKNQLRAALTEKKQQYIDETMTPFGFFTDNKPVNHKTLEESGKKLPSKENPYHLTVDQIELLRM
jgi:hypothetical protein